MSLLVLSKIDDKPHELMTTAVVRAKMCEFLALALEEPSSEVHFTVGLFSALDALLDLPLEEILESLPLSDEITSALLRHQGGAGELLRCVLAYEKEDWENVPRADLNPKEIRDAYLESVQSAGAVGSLVEG